LSSNTSPERPPARIGVVGGTFDPIHAGHLALALAAKRCARLDRVLLVPAAIPPHRLPATASGQDRLEMARVAAAGAGGLEVSDVEVRRSGPSYTSDTLRELTAANPGADLYLVLGWDAAREISSWHEPEAVTELARLVVVGRPGMPMPAPRDLLAAGLDPGRVILCSEPTPDVSATDLRAALASGGPIDHLLPEAVADYIAERGLYGPGSRA
jgi:nicotinate-nucleotide adenylyltransferase